MKRSSSNLTPSQAANLLAVSPSTIRLWSAQFADYLSDEARSDGRKHRSYSPDDIGVLKRASDLLKTHSPDETKALLAVADEAQQSAALATLPVVANEINALRSQLAALADQVTRQRAELETMRSEFQQFATRQAKRNKHQQAELETMRAELEALKARRSWWQRLRAR